MAKKAISVTLDKSNLLWLYDQTIRGGARNMSDAINRLITAARARDGWPVGPPRSVAGMVKLDPADPDLTKAQKFVRDEFARSIARTTAQLRDGLRPSPRRRRKTARA